MKIVSNTFLFFLPFVFVITGCNRHSEKFLPKSYTCQYTAKALVIDGKINEPQWKNALWSEPFVDIEGQRKPLPPFNTQMKMLWDKNYLYVAAKLQEPQLKAKLKGHDAIIYYDNDFEVFIDPDGDGLNYYELEINALGNVFDLFMKKPYSQNGKPDIAWDFEGLKTGIKLNGTLNNPNDTDSSWTVEAAIPWPSFSADSGKPPRNSDIWRINFSRVEWDYNIYDHYYVKRTDPETGRTLPEHNWVWSPQGVINMHVPDKWGFVKFEGRPRDEFPGLPVFWVWMDADKTKTGKQWDSTLRVLKKAGITGILMDADTNILKKVIPISDKYGMQVHAWFWTMNRSDAKPEWLSVNRLGQSLADHRAYVDYYKFMCPALPAVKSFLKSKMEQLAKIKGLRGVQLDYARYVDVILPIGLWDKYGLVQDHILPEYDYGYHPYMRRLFLNKYGDDPLDLEDGVYDSLWLAFRLNELNKTVFALRDYVNSKGLNISAAVFPTPEMSREMVRQDWDKWGLDYYFPMVYQNFYNQDIAWIGKKIKEDKSVLPKSARVFCGLYLPALKGHDKLTRAMKSAFEGGADGIAFFNFKALTPLQLQQIKAFKIKKPL